MAAAGEKQKTYPKAEFHLSSQFEPAGDQPAAIEKLTRGFQSGKSAQVLLGATGTGKTFSMANVIANLGRPALVLSHNKTLAAQLYSEFKEFFPENAVHYFVSYYDYYQPEAYIPQRDVYIEKDASINEEIDRLRLATTSSLVSRRDVVIVASVSSIYGLGSPDDYKQLVVSLTVGETIRRDHLLLKLVDVLYERNDMAFERGKFRVRGDSVELWPSYEEFAYRIEMWGDQIEKISLIKPVSGETIKTVSQVFVYPAKHFVMPEDRIQRALAVIREELKMQLEKFEQQGKLLEAQRLSARTRFDLEMLAEVGHCPGVENYSRPLSGKPPGATPDTLYSFFPEDFVTFVDESHVTVPQVRAMYAGDRSRKTTLVDHGFRLPSALDNRPLKFEEWEARTGQICFVSATPSDYELQRTGGEVVEQIIRPTGLLDPEIEVVSARGQVNHLVGQIRIRAERDERVLVTALTKRLAEDLSTYLQEQNIRCRWLHSELNAFERVDLLQELRSGHFDCLVGVNLLREGLDLPEVSLVAILDADKEGFLRSETSLIQTIGRAARNANSKVILYADSVTESMRLAMDETERRRALQIAYNEEHGITPETVHKRIKSGIESDAAKRRKTTAAAREESDATYITIEFVEALEQEMLAAAEDLEFERAAQLRDRVLQLKENIGKPLSEVEFDSKPSSGSGRNQRRKSPRGQSKGRSKIPRPKRG
ncbi:excinuclease ABC subunit UvrB [Rhodopirellula sp. MGV]|uniref:excinuclease ABC subunit UvrB n=1 Tax=Rhodopirellula sp. MGV TaxID=2023130 RepID=UPI000B968753|nr:excinuclease ABC subunit UvrB [Rhodopirellula sp. MGV]OYP38494.1 excinuclease ABC subunit B [Rhodopirellula sp. MGV]PNY33506.1 excinuclease ABC subunit UvrB [Rhodopirellula baltica]